MCAFHILNKFILYQKNMCIHTLTHIMIHLYTLTHTLIIETEVARVTRYFALIIITRIFFESSYFKQATGLSYTTHNVLLNTSYLVCFCCCCVFDTHTHKQYLHSLTICMKKLDEWKKNANDRVWRIKSVCFFGHFFFRYFAQWTMRLSFILFHCLKRKKGGMRTKQK